MVNLESSLGCQQQSSSSFACVPSMQNVQKNHNNVNLFVIRMIGLQNSPRADYGVHMCIYIYDPHPLLVLNCSAFLSNDKSLTLSCFLYVLHIYIYTPYNLLILGISKVTTKVATLTIT